MKPLPAICLVFASLLWLQGCGQDAPKCKNVTCGDNSSCEADTGDCVCDPSYTGATCGECAEGYHSTEGACVADECTGDADCDDGLACNGAETCQGATCQAGAAVECSANAACQEPDAACVCVPGFLLEGEACLPDLSILGSWIDDWGMDHDVTRDTWTNAGSVFHITQADGIDNFVVARNDAANPWNAGLWSKFEWGYGGDVLYYCQIAYAAETEQEAAAARASRASLTTGCGGFPWSRLRERLEITGAWVDGWGYDHDISQDTWDNAGSVFHITQLDNQADFLVAHNDPANAWSPDLWSRFDWTWDDAGGLHYCQIAYDAPDEATAAANTAADRASLDTGCGGFGWSSLSPR